MTLRGKLNYTVVELLKLLVDLSLNYRTFTAGSANLTGASLMWRILNDDSMDKIWYDVFYLQL